MNATHTRRFIVATVLVLVAAAGTASAQDDWNDGLKAFNAKDYATAAQQFQAVIQRAPDYAGAYYMLGLTQRAQGNTSQALGNLRKAVELDGDQALYRIELGNTLVQAGQYQDAFSTLQSVGFSSLPANYRGAYALAYAKAASEVGRCDAAITVLNQQVRADAKDARLYQALGACQAAQGDTAQAFDAYARAFELDPSNADVGRSAVKAGLVAGRRTSNASAKDALYTRSAGIAEKLASSSPSFEHQLLAGEAWMGAKDYGKAISWFEKAKAKQPQNALVYHYLAQSQTSLGQLDAALANEREALKIGVSGKLRTQVYNQLGFIYDKQKDYVRAEDAYRQAGNSRMVAEMQQKAELNAQNLQADQERKEFERKLQALELQIQELEKLGEVEQANELRRQLEELRKALPN